eukprot:GHVR01037749.1.p3 GENE.GHVR01037749.1~~GHVR01037749.1.p3  ORF type:complete len:129 (+),score=23.23 GHVR01037749.1:73-459(+)
MIASAGNHFVTAEDLIQKGADMNIRNAEGRSAIELCSSWGQVYRMILQQTNIENKYRNEYKNENKKKTTGYVSECVVEWCVMCVMCYGGGGSVIARVCHLVRAPRIHHEVVLITAKSILARTHEMLTA